MTKTGNPTTTGYKSAPQAKGVKSRPKARIEEEARQALFARKSADGKPTPELNHMQGRETQQEGREQWTFKNSQKEDVQGGQTRPRRGFPKGTHSEGDA